MVRLSKIEVRMEDLEEYNALLKEEILASVKLEPGVLTLYAVSLELKDVSALIPEMKIK